MQEIDAGGACISRRLEEALNYCLITFMGTWQMVCLVDLKIKKDCLRFTIINLAAKSGSDLLSPN